MPSRRQGERVKSGAAKAISRLPSRPAGTERARSVRYGRRHYAPPQARRAHPFRGQLPRNHREANYPGGLRVVGVSRLLSCPASTIWFRLDRSQSDVLSPIRRHREKLGVREFDATELRRDFEAVPRALQEESSSSPDRRSKASPQARRAVEKAGLKKYDILSRLPCYPASKTRGAIAEISSSELSRHSAGTELGPSARRVEVTMPLRGQGRARAACRGFKAAPQARR